MKHINRDLTVATGILFALAGTAVPASALTSISGCPAAITTPGNYQLTADLACTVVISASNVSLALNGHTITAPANFDGIDVNYSPFTGPGAGRLNQVAIKGPGLIKGNGPDLSGIYIVATDHSQIDMVMIEGAFGAGISDYGGPGDTFLTIASNVISGQTSSTGFGDGIFLANPSTSCAITETTPAATVHAELSSVAASPTP